MRSSSSSKYYLPKINPSLMHPKNLLRLNRMKELIYNDIRELSLLPQLLLYVQPSFEKKINFNHLLEPATLLSVKRNSFIRDLDQLFGRSILKAFSFFRVSEIHIQNQFVSKFWKCSQKCRQRSFFSYVLRRCNELLKPAT